MATVMLHWLYTVLCGSIFALDTHQLAFVQRKNAVATLQYICAVTH